MASFMNPPPAYIRPISYFFPQSGQHQGKQEGTHSAATDEKRKSSSSRNKSRNSRLVYRRPMAIGVYRRTDSAGLFVSVVIYSVQEKDGNEGLILKSCLSLQSIFSCRMSENIL